MLCFKSSVYYLADSSYQVFFLHVQQFEEGDTDFMTDHKNTIYKTGVKFKGNKLLASRASELTKWLVLQQIYWPAGLVTFKFNWPAGLVTFNFTGQMD